MGKLFTLHCSSLLICVNEYLAIGSGEYLCTSGLRELIAAWLNASQRSRDGIQSNRSAREKIKSALSNPDDWILRYIRTYLY